MISAYSRDTRHRDFHRGNCSAGFTLVEVVVALSIMSLLMIAVTAAMRTLGNSQSSIERVTDRIDEVRAVSSFLRDALEATVASSGSGGGLTFGGSGIEAKEYSYFSGDGNGFEWKARMVFGENHGGTFLLRLMRVEDSLVLKWQRPPQVIESRIWEDQSSRVLVDQVEDVQISFRGEPDQEWQEQWEAPGSPSMVRLNIKANDRYWPELIMSVQQ